MTEREKAIKILRCEIDGDAADALEVSQDAISEYTHAQDRIKNTMDSFDLKKYECGQDLSQLKVTKAESDDLQTAIRAVEEGDDLR